MGIEEDENETRNAKLDLEPILDRSYNVDEIETNDREAQFEQKQPIQEKANKNRVYKPKNAVTKKKTDASESVLAVNVDSHSVSNVEPVFVQEEIPVPLHSEEV